MVLPPRPPIPSAPDPAPAPPRPPGPALTPEQERFRELLGGMDRAWVTRALLGANLVVALVMVSSGVSILLPDPQAAVAFGANFGPLTLAGEWWRLLSSVFLHHGAIHLGFNMYVLFVVGPLVERIYGHLAYALVYLFAGVAGSVASVLWNPAGVSAGASGAIFGLFGALLVFLLWRRSLVPAEALKRIRGGILAFIAFNVAFGFVVPGIDQAAHLGGLVGGALAGVVVAPSVRAEGASRPFARMPIVLLAAVALVAYVAYLGSGVGSAGPFDFVFQP